MRYRGTSSPGKYSRSCCAVHAAVGWSVTATSTTRRSFVGKDDEHKQEPACRGRHHEEIGSRDLLKVIRRECAPRLRSDTPQPCTSRPSLEKRPAPFSSARRE